MESKIFKSKQQYVYYDQLLKSTPDKIFPLLCPKKEYDWIESWKCDIIFSNSGFAELDCVFVTGLPEDTKETWIVDIFDKDKKIQFARFSGSRIIRHSISLTDNNNGTTTAKWEQTITSLNSEGNLYIEKFFKIEFEKRIKALEKMLNYYLTTGKMLRTNN